MNSKLNIRHFIVSILCAVWATLCFVLPDFCDNPIYGVQGILTVGAYLTALGVFQWLIIYLFSLNRVVFAIFLPVYSIAGAALAYFRVAFHSTPTPMLVEATLNTNAGTVSGVLSWQLIAYIALNLAIAALFVRERWLIPTPDKVWLHLIVSLTALLVYYNANHRLQSSLRQRYPLHVIHACREYFESKRALSDIVLQDPDILTAAPPDSLTVVLVLGEALRADHLQLNGYPRETTPRLAARSNVVSLSHIFTEHTHTAASLPHILTPADSLCPEDAYRYHSCVSCFKRCGFSTAWISNQDMGRTYYNFIHEADTHIFPNADKSVFVFSGWYDRQLLDVLDSLRQTQPQQPRQLYVLHCIGSHWYYNIHVPDSMQVFKPVTDNRVVTANSDEQIINSYDNTAYYADYVIDALTRRLENENAIVLFLADHGESLGEDGNYLHAAGAEPTKYPAALVWYSDSYARIFPDKVAALRQNADRRYRTDYMFYSILSAAGIEAAGNNSSFDIFMNN